jgi:hypothetical protein
VALREADKYDNRITNYKFWQEGCHTTGFILMSPILMVDVAFFYAFMWQRIKEKYIS